MPRVSTGNRTQVWRTYGAEETTSAEPHPKSPEPQSLPASSVHASGGGIRTQLDFMNRKRRAMRKQIADRTRALAELDAHVAELERRLRELASCARGLRDAGSTPEHIARVLKLSVADVLALLSDGTTEEQQQ